MRKKRYVVPFMALILGLMTLAVAVAFSGCGKSESAGDNVVAEENLTAEATAEPQTETAVVEDAAAEEAPEETAASAPPPASPAPKTPPAATSVEPAMVEIPSLIGIPFEEAVAALNTLGLQAIRAEDNSQYHAAGMVCDQDPSGGGTVAAGSTVTLVVSMGPVSKACPACGGDGTLTSTVTCPECGGTGYCYT